jgi:hypothetical protein
MVLDLGYQVVNEAAQKFSVFYFIFKHTNSNVHFGLIIFSLHILCLSISLAFS